MAAEEVQVGDHVVRVTSGDRVVLPELGVTKRDVVAHVLAVGDALLAALDGRPTTVERWPQGVQPGFSLTSRDNPDGEAFYQKRAPAKRPDFVDVADVRFPSGRPATMVTPRNVATLVWLANLGTLRFHPWPVTAPDVDHVDELRLDLDPQPGTDASDAAAAALVVREVLAEVGITGFPKTSGGRGLPVHARIEPADFVDARHAVIAIAREVERRMPDRVTTSWWKEERGERVFIDFNQMARDRLMTSAYSIRPTAAGLVSTPLTWEEVPDVQPSDHTILTVADRVATIGDPWAALHASTPASLGAALAWWERDVADGLGEMPYPPEYPKMPGEPKRVQPSKDRDRPRADAAED